MRTLVDTGALLALLDRDDRWHGACAHLFPTLDLPLLTTAPVLTELFHLVASRRHESDTAWGFIRSGAVTVHSIDDDDLPRLNALMTIYRDRPMDFADASLVCLAERTGIDTVFTIDFADFETYRIGEQRAFHVIPDRVVSGNS